MKNNENGIPARLERIRSTLAQIDALIARLKAGETGLEPETKKPGLRLVHSIKKVG
jgi:hypothetical protein